MGQSTHKKISQNEELQGSTKRHWPGLVNFAPAGAYGYLEVGLMENGLKSFFRPTSSLEDWKMV